MVARGTLPAATGIGAASTRGPRARATPRIATQGVLVALIAPLALLILAGCASSPRTYYSPSRTRAAAVTISPAAKETTTPIETRQFVPADFAHEELRIACEARAFDDAITDRVSLPTLRIRIWLYNYSKHQLELRPGEFYVIDDLDRRLPAPSVEHDGQKTGIVLATPPIRSSIDLVFRLPEGYDLTKPRAVRLFWGFRLDDHEYRHETIFEPNGDRGFRDPFIAIAPRSS